MSTDHELSPAWWRSRGIEPGDEAMAAAQALLPSLEARFAAPRDPALMRTFVRDMLPPGEIFVYGAGTHTPALLEALTARPDIRVRGLVDRMADALQNMFGLPVLRPDQLRAESFDYVLTSHTTFEAEMVRAARGAGVDADRIRCIYSDPSFRAMSRAAYQPPPIDEQFDAVIVSTAIPGIISEQDLLRLFPAEKTLLCYMGRADSRQHLDAYPRVDLHESLDLLVDILERIQPRAVYLRLSIYKNFYALYLKAKLPQLRFIVEFYDLTILWRDRDLEEFFGLDPASIRANRLAEFYAFEKSDYLISKRGGRAWDARRFGIKAEYALYIPQLSDDVPERSSAPCGAGIRCAYAGFVPAPNVLATTGFGYRFLHVMEALAETGRYEFELFNSLHATSADDVYRAYLDKYRGPGVLYHRQTEYTALLDRLRNFDLGWMCDASLQPGQIDRIVVIPNRLTGYLSAGLPPLVDAHWEFAADLIRDHGAGVVVDEVTPQGIEEAVQKFYRPSLRDGVRSLHASLKRQNDDVLDRIQHARSKWPRQSGHFK